MRSVIKRKRLVVFFGVALLCGLAFGTSVFATGGSASQVDEPGLASISNGWITCVTYTDGVACKSNGHWSGINGSKGAIAVSVPQPPYWHEFFGSGGLHACALYADGTVACWGQNSDGQLGDGTTNNSTVALTVPGLTDAVAISTTESSSCAIHKTGKVSCWGKVGQEQHSAPIQIPDISDARSITGHCAVFGSGTVACWHSTSIQGPITTTQLADVANALSVSPGNGDPCITHQDGRVSCGTDTSSDRDFVAGISTAVDVNTYSWATDVVVGDGGPDTDWGKCALLADGSVTCWDKDNPTPTLVSGISNMVSLGTDRYSRCAVDGDDQLWCWGTDGVEIIDLKAKLATSLADGYWLLHADAAVTGLGGVPHLAQLSSESSSKAVAFAGGPDGQSLWILDSSGTVRTRGTALHFGNVTNLAPADKAATIEATASGLGYWIFTEQGTVFAFGDAEHYGDLAGLGITPVGLIVDSAATASGQGYYLLGSDGGVFAFGDAKYLGSIPEVLPGVSLTCPIVGVVAADTSSGYWLVGCDGGVFTFGDAPFKGSLPGLLPSGSRLNAPISGMVRYADGYLMVASDGGVFNISNGPFVGSLGAITLDQPIVDIAPRSSTQTASPQADTAQMMAVALTHLVEYDNTFGAGPPPFSVYLIRDFTSSLGGKGGATDRPLTAAEQTAIEKAVSKYGPVTWGGNDAEWLDEDFNPVIPRSAILATGVPHIEGNTAFVRMSMQCGNLCGTWFTYKLEFVNGAWVVNGIDGPIAIS